MRKEEKVMLRRHDKRSYSGNPERLTVAGCAGTLALFFIFFILLALSSCVEESPVMYGLTYKPDLKPGDKCLYEYQVNGGQTYIEEFVVLDRLPRFVKGRFSDGTEKWIRANSSVYCRRANK